MDSSCNPFSPNAGSRPPAFVGRDDVLRDADILIGRLLFLANHLHYQDTS